MMTKLVLNGFPELQGINGLLDIVDTNDPSTPIRSQNGSGNTRRYSFIGISTSQLTQHGFSGDSC
jgi:hypothetical protein